MEVAEGAGNTRVSEARDNFRVFEVEGLMG